MVVMAIVALVLAILVYLLMWSMDCHWVVCLLLASIPAAATIFGGLYGAMFSAVFVGGLFRASAGRR